MRRLVLPFVLTKLVVHAFAITHYGYFRDELYYLACTQRLAFGYVDHPPLSILVLRVWRAVFGDSLVAIRLVPLGCGALQLVLAGVLAAELGGGAFAVALACGATLCAPVLLAFSHHYSMNAIDGVLWTLALVLLHRATTGKKTSTWVWLASCSARG